MCSLYSCADFYSFVFSQRFPGQNPEQKPKRGKLFLIPAPRRKFPPVRWENRLTWRLGLSEFFWRETIWRLSCGDDEELDLFVTFLSFIKLLCAALLLQSHGSVANADSKTAGKRGQKPRKKPGGKNGKEATKKVHGAAGETGVQWPWVTLQRSAARLSSHLHLDFCYLPLRHQWRFRRFKNRGWLSGRSGFFPLIIIIFFTSWMWVNFWGDKNKVKKKKKRKKLLRDSELDLTGPAVTSLMMSEVNKVSHMDHCKTEEIFPAAVCLCNFTTLGFFFFYYSCWGKTLNSFKNVGDISETFFFFF